MICPRCGNEWDANKSPCTRCGLVIRMPGQSGPMGRTASPSMQKNISQQPDSFLRSQSGVQFGDLPPLHSQSQPFSSSRRSDGMQNAAQPFSSPQRPLPRSANGSSLSATELPRPSASQRSNPGFERNMQNRPTSQAPTNFGSTQVGGPRSDSLASKGVPHRPQSAYPAGRSANSYVPDMQRIQNAPRPSRLVTNPLTSESQRYRNNPSPDATRTSSSGSRMLLPGTVLRGGRYRLHELHERQEWLSGAYEATWIAQDAQRGASQVMICELFFPENDSIVVQSTLRTATMALTSVGRHPHIPTLWDAFSDRGRNFFVFEPVQGESLLNNMRRTGRAMSELDVIECCLQMTEVLELLAQHSPPLVHGLIRPEHILVGRTGSQYILTSFSIVLAGGATQYVAGIDRTRLSPYVAPEFIRGVIDVRSDLYALMATMYHAVTGNLPTGVSGSIPPAQRLNPNISPQFDAILAKGLRPIASQRYQRPSELRQDLLAMRSVSGTLVPGSGQSLEQPLSRVSEGAQRGQNLDPAAAQRLPDSIAQAFQSLIPEDDEDRRLLLPRPEELPPLEQRNDSLHATFWLVSILVCLVLVIILSRGFF